MYTIDDAASDLAMMYCSHCREFKSECQKCGNMYCCFCEFDCECDD